MWRGEERRGEERRGLERRLESCGKQMSEEYKKGKTGREVVKKNEDGKVYHTII